MLRKALLLSCLLGLLLAAPASAATIRMDLNAIYPESNFHSQGAIEFAKKVETATNGGVVITVHAGGALGFKGPELLRSVKDAAVPMSDILMGVVGGSEEIFGISSMPRVATTYEEARKFYDIARPAYEKACERWNQKLLYAAPWPPSGIFAKRAMNTPDDLRGLKIRTYDRNGALFLEAAGSHPMSLPWGEVYSALQTGLADSVLTSAVSGKDGKFWEVLSDFAEIGYAFPLNMVTINLDWWKALSKEQQDAMLAVAAEVEASQWQVSADQNAEAIAAVKAGGITVQTPPAAVQERLDEIARKMLDDFLATAKPETKAVFEAYLK